MPPLPLEVGRHRNRQVSLWSPCCKFSRRLQIHQARPRANFSLRSSLSGLSETPLRRCPRSSPSCHPRCSVRCSPRRSDRCGLNCSPHCGLGRCPGCGTSRCPRCPPHYFIRYSPRCSDHCGRSCRPRCSPRSSDRCSPDCSENSFPNCPPSCSAHCCADCGFSNDPGHRFEALRKYPTPTVLLDSSHPAPVSRLVATAPF